MSKIVVTRGYSKNERKKKVILSIIHENKKLFKTDENKQANNEDDHDEYHYDNDQ